MHENIFKLFKERVARLSANCIEEIYPESIVLQAEYACTENPVPFRDRLKLTYRPIREGEVWGKAWDSAWFHLTGTVPGSFAGKEICLRLNIGSEMLVYGQDGVPLCGLTNHCIFDPQYIKDRVLLNWLRPGDPVDIWVEGAANEFQGIDMPSAEEKDPPHPLGEYHPLVSRLQLCSFDRQTWLFLLEMETLADSFSCYSADDYRSRQLLHALNRAADVFAYDPANAAAARQMLQETVFTWKADSGALTASSIGHAHIDLGFMWPLRESTRKAARTFANQLLLMEQYPEYKFGASQPYLYREIKEHYPELYEKIRQRVKEGRWELQGGMYVEADCNLISGESMVRQFLYGKNFFMDEFGVNVRNLWLPDVFGYSAAMPQIIRKAQCEFFLSQKISWSEINRFPHHTFRWTGVDGSSVIAHFLPEDTYGAKPNISVRTAAANRFSEGGFLPGFMSLVGIGDGGGGPSEDYVERCRMLRDLRGCPKTQWRFAADFFREMEAWKDELPEWCGELYLEMHRGTFTTQSETKRLNRRCEQALASLEFLASALPAGEWPREKLAGAWETLLTNQFHDIIPGSSIREVYEREEAELAEILSMTETESAALCSRLFHSDDRCAVLVNTLSCEWSGRVELPERWNDGTVKDEAGNELPSQLEDGRLHVSVSVPGGSCLTLFRGDGQTAAVKDTGKRVLENGLVRYEFNAEGRLVSAYDKDLQKEFLTGEGNVFSFYNDRPRRYDAWEVDIYYPRDRKGSPVCVSAGTATAGPAGASIEFVYRTEHSEIKQRAVLAPETRRLDFETDVDWHEYRTLLRTSFPVAVSSEHASYDIQYAYVERPTHDNTSWDEAKFEVCGQRYADLSNLDCGAALLTDSKYGYSAKGSTLGLSLLRSPKYPDRSADIGKHHFTYSFLPHPGTLTESEVMREAAALNRPVQIFDGFDGSDFEFPCRMISAGISLEVVKRAEKDDSLILRLVEIRGKHSSGVLHFSRIPARVSVTDLLEWENGPKLKLGSRELELAMKPFEILTLRAEF